MVHLNYITCHVALLCGFLPYKDSDFLEILELSSSFYRLSNLQAVQGKPPKAVTGLVGAVGQIHLT